ncbi:EthD family reductase [Trinickia terrae]|uniref:EthD family reductase n=1 Tax=Trinickia terrae TaxID=2571161 RepID=A0A4U1HGU1_9BURK|nr:EthD family reductase [Trinickia terrae]TKC80241.1 EthD family reductase [Trinickia terrae]
MSVEACLFLIGGGPGIDVGALSSAAQEIAGLKRFVFHCRDESPSGDPFLKSPANHPNLVFQWYFDDLGLLEAALQRQGAIQSALEVAARMLLDHGAFVQQVMAVRKLKAEDGQAPAERCTYLVSYEGEADDFNAWLTHYMTHHPPLMMQLPGLRELEIYTRVDYRTGLAFARAAAMQRNKVAFDDFSALSAALASPVRAKMKADFDALPRYRGDALHYPMHSIYGNLPAS